MPKDKKPPRRRSKPAVPKIEQPAMESQPVVEPRVELHPVPRPEALARARPPIVARVAEVIRTVAVALIDLADAAVESLTRRPERHT